MSGIESLVGEIIKSAPMLEQRGEEVVFTCNSKKSAVVHQLAKRFNRKLVDVHLAQEDPTVLNGFLIPQIKEYQE